MCKHICAVLLKYIAVRIEKNKEVAKKAENMGEHILNKLKVLKQPKEKIKLEVNLPSKSQMQSLKIFYEYFNSYKRLEF